MATGVNNVNTRVYATGAPISFTDEATQGGADHQHFSITNEVKRILDPDTPVVVQEAHDEVQTLTMAGGPTGGTFIISFSGDPTGNIAYNALAGTVQTALQALSSIGAGNALVTGSAGAWTVQFTATLGQANQAALTTDGTLLTGGSSPHVTVATVQDGAAFATISSGFTLYLIGGRVSFASAQAQGTAVRLHSGDYRPYTAIAGANTAEFSGQLAMIDTTDFEDDGWHGSTPTTSAGTIKCHTFWRNSTLISNLTNHDLLVVSYFDGNEWLEGFCWVGNSDLKSAAKGVVEADYTFELTDQFFVNISS